jgi:Fe-S cluster biosynthesis and repair protein YggX
MACLEDRNARSEWGIDTMLIDEELLYLDDTEADRVYKELFEKTMRRRTMEVRENRLS